MGEAHCCLDCHFDNPNAVTTDAKFNSKELTACILLSETKPLPETFPLVTISESIQEDDWLSDGGGRQS